MVVKWRLYSRPCVNVSQFWRLIEFSRIHSWFIFRGFCNDRTHCWHGWYVSKNRFNCKKYPVAICWIHRRTSHCWSWADPIGPLKASSPQYLECSAANYHSQVLLTLRPTSILLGSSSIQLIENDVSIKRTCEVWVHSGVILKPVHTLIIRTLLGSRVGNEGFLNGCRSDLESR